jgi:hypothetical protein
MSTYYVGGKKVVLGKNDFIGKGGEGEVFVQGGKVYKIYHDPKKVLPSAKFSELQMLVSPNIIRPQEEVYAKNNQVAGYTMDHVRDSVPLVRLFSNGFRRQNQITPEMTVTLVESIQSVIQFIHNQDILVVDGNEMNYLVSEKDLTTPYFIDVDSYQTPNFPAPVIMESIRDWQSKAFSKVTDWFSFGIIACQLFLGIHPFKGRHPQFPKRDLKARMLGNTSIFNADTKIPATTRDFSCVPTEYMEWFVALFEEGKRIPPPQVLGILNVLVQKAIIKGSQLFDIQLIKEFQENILDHTCFVGNQAVLTEKSLVTSRTKIDFQGQVPKVVFSTETLESFFVNINSDQLVFTKDGNEVWNQLQAKKVMVYDNRAYAKSYDKIYEIQLSYLGNKHFFSVAQTWKVLPHSTQMLDGVLFQNILGKAQLLIPYQTKCCAMPFVSELDSYKIIDGKYENQVCVLIGFQNGQYDRITLVLDKDYETYHCRIQENIDYQEVNFTVLQQGVTISMIEEGKLEVFSNQYSAKAKVNEFHDDEMTANIKLTHEGSKAMFFQNNQLFSMAMKKQS